MAKGTSKSHELVDNEEFLKGLTALFESTKKGGSVWLTHKRLTYEDPSHMQEDAGDGDREYPCILHATDGKTRTIATHVNASSLTTFHAHYGTLLKTTMTQTLRKRDKKKEKARMEALIAKKKKIAEGVTVTGPKRGTGRRKRVRLERARKRMDEAKRKHDEREKKVHEK